MLVVCDESSKGRYLFLGTLWAPKSIVPSLTSKIIKIRIDNNLWGEVKWETLSEKYLEKYKAFLLPFLEIEKVYFHSIVIPKGEPWFSIKRFFGRNGMYMRERFLGFLLSKRSREWMDVQGDCSFIYLLDRNLLKEREEDEENWPVSLRNILRERGISIEIIASCSSHIFCNFQALDLILGAVCSKWSEKEEPLNSTQKKLIEFIEDKTNSDLKDFDIWSVGFSKKINNWKWKPYLI